MSVHRSFRLDEALDARLVAYAGELGRPVSWVIVRALRDRFGPVGGFVPEFSVERARTAALVDSGSVGVRVVGGSVVRSHLPTCKCGVCKPVKS